MPVKYGYDTVLDNAANNEQVGFRFDNTVSAIACSLNQQFSGIHAQCFHQGQCLLFYASKVHPTV